MNIVNIILTVLSLLSLINSAEAGFISNGNFASGNLSGWTTSGDNSYTSVVQSGTLPNNLPGDQYHLEVGTIGGSFGLSQSFATVIGQSFTFSFYVDDQYKTDALQVLWDGNSLLNITDFATNGWQLYSFSEVANSTSTSIQFNLSDSSAYLGLADVSVSSGPAPAVSVPALPKIYLFGLGLGLAFISWMGNRQCSRTQIVN